MAIGDALTKIQLLMALAAIFIVCLSCGTDDETVVEPDTAMEPDVSVEEPDPVVPVESPKDGAEEVEDVSATVRGLVLDQITKTPLIDVRVQLTDEAGVALETPTTALGVFEFEGVAADQQLTIVIDPDAYEKQEFTVDPIPVGETVKLEVELTPLNPEQLPVGDGLAVGLKGPDFNLPNSDGEMIALADYVGKQKVVLVFDRGGW